MYIDLDEVKIKDITVNKQQTITIGNFPIVAYLILFKVLLFWKRKLEILSKREGHAIGVPEGNTTRGNAVSTNTVPLRKAGVWNF